MMHRDPAIFFFAPIEHRKFDDPAEIHFFGIVKFELSSEAASQTIQNTAGQLEKPHEKEEQVVRFGL